MKEFAMYHPYLTAFLIFCAIASIEDMVKAFCRRGK
jgi:hypothetical protein